MKDQLNIIVTEKHRLLVFLARFLLYKRKYGENNKRIESFHDGR